MEEAETLCDRVAIIDHGDIVAFDSPSVLKDQLGGDIVTLTVANGDEAAYLGETLSSYSWITEIHCKGREIQITLTHGQTRIPALITSASEAEVSVTSVDLQTPSLESVFLTHTGRTIAETGAETATNHSLVGTEQ